MGNGSFEELTVFSVNSAAAKGKSNSALAGK
jgi:hypothetical protein